LLGTASSNPLSKAKNQSPTNPINIHLRYILELHWMIRKMQKTVKKQEKPSKSDFYGFYVVFTLFSRCFHVVFPNLGWKFLIFQISPTPTHGFSIFLHFTAINEKQQLKSMVARNKKRIPKNY
jgi:hypothetical protein